MHIVRVGLTRVICAIVVQHFTWKCIMNKYIEIDGRLVEVKNKTIEINGNEVDTQGEINIYVRQMNAGVPLEKDTRRMTKLKSWLSKQAKSKINMFYKID